MSESCWNCRKPATTYSNARNPLCTDCKAKERPNGTVTTDRWDGEIGVLFGGCEYVVSRKVAARMRDDLTAALATPAPREKPDVDPH